MKLFIHYLPNIISGGKHAMLKAFIILAIILGIFLWIDDREFKQENTSQVQNQQTIQTQQIQTNQETSK